MEKFNQSISDSVSDVANIDDSLTSDDNVRLRGSHSDAEQDFVLGPNIKEDLRASLLEKGTVVEDLPKELHKMTAEEEEKQRIRRGLNCMAARKYREKKKQWEDALKKLVQRLESSNATLQAETNQLRTEMEHLTIILQNHQCSGECRLDK